MSAEQLRQVKARLRRRLLAQRAGLTVTEIDQKSAAITTHVCVMPIFQASQTLMVYMALPHEVQTATIITAARQHQKRIVIPVVRSRELVVAVCPTEAVQLQPGPYGILEPCEVQTIVPPQEIDCVFVPGVGFDVHGARLGFGQGYYDRFLRQLPSTTTYGGLAFHLQIVPCVPHMEHDIRMHFVVTEQGMIPCRHTLS